MAKTFTRVMTFTKQIQAWKRSLKYIYAHPMDNSMLVQLRQLIDSMAVLIRFTACPHKRALILVLMIPCFTRFHMVLFTSQPHTLIIWYLRAITIQYSLLCGNAAIVLKSFLASKLLTIINQFISVHESCVLKDIMAEVDNSADLHFHPNIFNS